MPANSAARTGSGCSSIARRPAARTSAWLAGSATPDCGRLPSSRTSTSAPTAASTVFSSSSSPPASGSASTIIWPWSVQLVSASRGWPAPSATRPVAKASRCSTKRASRLFTDLGQARGEGRLPRLMTALERTRLLIIDDWGPEPLNPEQRRDLLEIVDDRYDRGSLLITSQVPVNRWHEVIGDPTLADAILDRIIHRAHRIDLKGPSLRRRVVASETAAA